MTMSVIALVFAWRKPSTTPAEFKSHYESGHMPLLQSIAGAHFPKSHTRLCIQRLKGDASAASTDVVGNNAGYPANVLIGTQADFDYDAVAELMFEDHAHLQAFTGAVYEKEAAEKLAQDEGKFLDRAQR